MHRTGTVGMSHGGGRPHGYGEADMERLRQIIHAQPDLRSRDLLREMGAHAPRITERTMRSYRRELTMTPRRGQVTVRANPQHIAQRRAFARKNRRAAVTRWVHTDEMHFSLRDTGHVVWAERGQPTPRPEVTGLKGTVHVWGMVWDRGAVFTQFEGHLDSQLYIDLLEEHYLPERENLGNRRFLVDQHPVHKSRQSIAWYEEHDVPYLVLPPHSPEFNAIEDCWSWIKRRTRQFNCASLAELQEQLEIVCDELPVRVIRGCLRHAAHALREYE